MNANRSESVAAVYADASFALLKAANLAFKIFTIGHR